MAILSIDNVTKKFGDLIAVNDLSFAVQPGEIYGFLGGNGAGKTTTLRMVLDIIRPTSGTISVVGASPDQRNAKSIGFLPEERGLYGNMTALDTIVYFGRLKGMSAGDARVRGMELLERFELADRAKTNVSELSKGMAQKVQLATAVVNAPQLLILDEPFSGLDPLNQGVLEAEIHRAAERGAAVVFSTHVMQHAERLCDRLLLLRKGEKRFEGTIDDARMLLPSIISVISQQDIAPIAGVASAQRGEALGDGWYEWQVALKSGVDAGSVLEACSAAQVPLRRFEERRASLHDVFVHVVGGEGTL